MVKAYAGIGSRKTPSNIRVAMIFAAARLASDGYILRSGGAAGADHTFFCGIPRGLRGTKAEIFLPGDRLNDYRAGQPGVIDATTLPAWPKALSMVSLYHPAPERLSGMGRKLMARNAMQILGPNLDDPVKFVFCWTPGGQLVGGTSQALRMAVDHGIPIKNLGRVETLDACCRWLLADRRSAS